MCWVVNGACLDILYGNITDRVDHLLTCVLEQLKLHGIKVPLQLVQELWVQHQPAKLLLKLINAVSKLHDIFLKKQATQKWLPNEA